MVSRLALASSAAKRSACKTSVIEAPPSVLLCSGGVPGAEENDDPTRKFERRPRTPAVLLPRIIVPRFEIDDIAIGVVARLLPLPLAPLAPSNRLPLPSPPLLSLSLPGAGECECECDWDGVERWPIAVARFTDMIWTRESPTRDQE